MFSFSSKYLQNAKAFLSPSEQGFHRTVCGHVIDAVEGTKGEAAFVKQGRSTGPQLRLLGSISHGFPGINDRQ